MVKKVRSFISLFRSIKHANMPSFRGRTTDVCGLSRAHSVVTKEHKLNVNAQDMRRNSFEPGLESRPTASAQWEVLPKDLQDFQILVTDPENAGDPNIVNMLPSGPYTADDLALKAFRSWDTPNPELQKQRIEELSIRGSDALKPLDNLNSGLDTYGTYKYLNGDEFWGMNLNGEKHGSGVWTRANGDVVVGSFERDYMHGYCQTQFANGDYAECHYWHGAKHGPGLLVKANGDYLQGEWELDEFVSGDSTIVDYW